jgi:hypothetical protein
MTESTALSAPVRRAGFLAGAVIGAALAARTADVVDPTEIASRLTGRPLPLAPPTGRRPAATALADGLLEELLGGGVDLERLAGRWTTWWRDDGLDADPALIEALAHLETYHAPADQLDSTGPAAVAAALPAALAAGSPRAMVSGAFHTTRLLDPTAESGWAAVAVVVTASRFLGGQRDSIGDVLAVLRVNGAPEVLIDRFAMIPRDRRRVPQPPRGVAVSAIDVAVWALWHAEYAPSGVRALEQMVAAGGVGSVPGAVLGALLGARDGLAEWPIDWQDGSGEDVRLRHALAARLGG